MRSRGLPPAPPRPAPALAWTPAARPGADAATQGLDRAVCRRVPSAPPQTGSALMLGQPGPAVQTAGPAPGGACAGAPRPTAHAGQARARAASAALTTEPAVRSCSSYSSATVPDCPNWSTPTGTAGTPSAEPIQAMACEEASWTVTTGVRSGSTARSAPGTDGVVAVRIACRKVRCHAP